MKNGKEILESDIQSIDNEISEIKYAISNLGEMENISYYENQIELLESDKKELQKKLDRFNRLYEPTLSAHERN